MSFRCLRATKSVSGTHFFCLGIIKTGELEPPGETCKSLLSAVTGQREPPLRSGKGIKFFSILHGLRPSDY